VCVPPMIFLPEVNVFVIVLAKTMSGRPIGAT